MSGMGLPLLLHDQVAGLLSHLPADVGADRIVRNMLVARAPDGDQGMLLCCMPASGTSFAYASLQY